MCDKCVELDKKIERYREVSSSLTDQITIDRIKSLIDELQAQKLNFTPSRSRLSESASTAATRWCSAGRL
jgi:hypothetical protein